MRHGYRDPGGLRSSVDLLQIKPDRWLITGVRTARSDRGNGAASRTFRTVLADADREDVVLVLGVYPDESGGLDAEALREWYRRNGFVPTAEHANDPNMLIREPR